LKTIKHILIKEFQQLKRDPKMFMIVLIAPIVQLIFLGYAANLDVEKVHIAFYDMDKTSESRNFIRQFDGSTYFSNDYSINSYEELNELIDKGKVITGIVIPKDFEKKVARRDGVKVQAIIDGSDGNTASIASGYMMNVIRNYNQDVLLETMGRLGRKFVPVGSLASEIRVWFNPEQKTRIFMVPAIVGLLLTIVTMLLTSLAIVKEKEIGTYEQLVVTPIKSYQLIIGKLLPFAILGFISVLIILLAQYVIFDIAVRGSEFFLIFASFLYVLSTLGLGLFVSTISKTQQQAMMLAIFVVMLPMVYLSGFVFPIENMPKIIQYITYIIPLKYFLIIIRGVILKGIGFGELWSQTLILFLMGVFILLAASIRYHKKSE